jgi:hypothetical protein
MLAYNVAITGYQMRSNWLPGISSSFTKYIYVMDLLSAYQVTSLSLSLSRRSRKIVFAAIFFGRSYTFYTTTKDIFGTPLRYRLLNFRRSSVADVTEHRSRLESPRINKVPCSWSSVFFASIFLRRSALQKRLYWLGDNLSLIKR